MLVKKLKQDVTIYQSINGADNCPVFAGVQHSGTSYNLQLHFVVVAFCQSQQHFSGMHYLYRI